MKPNKCYTQGKLQTGRSIAALLMLPLFFLLCMNARAAGDTDALQRKVTLTVKNQTLQYIASEIKRQTDVKFSFSAGAIRSNGAISFSVTDKKLIDLLNGEFATYNIDFKVINEQIVLFQKTIKAAYSTTEAAYTGSGEKQAEITVTGKITNSQDQPLTGVTINEKNTTNGTTTDENGNFKLRVSGSNAVLEMSYVG